MKLSDWARECPRRRSVAMRVRTRPQPLKISEEQSQSLDGGEEVEVILEPIDNAVRRVYNTNKIEAKYIPEVVLNSRTIEELLNAPEFIGDTVELE